MSPRLGGRNTNFNPGIENLVVEILIVSPRLGGRNIIFNRGNETLESRLWRACPVPGLFPVPGLCRLSGCFLNVYSITSWFVIICYFIFCSTALYYNMLFVIYYVLCMRFFLLWHVIFHYASSGYCVTSWFRFCYVLLCSVMFSYMLFHLVRLYYVMLWYIILYSLIRRNPL